jgi:CDP-4-dehydro-6-deoxyglucose reductase, E3
MGFTVTIRPSGRTLETEGDETVLAAALRNGIGLPYGCKNGACGTCRGKLVEGVLVHGPHSATALSSTDEAKGYALFCSARPESDVVIEARELTGFGDIPVRKMPARIAKIDRPAPDVAIVSVQLPANERLQYRAGQYMDIILKDGARRQYSMATAPHADELIQLHIRHTPGGAFTDRLFGVASRRSRNATSCASRRRWELSSCGDNARPIVLLAGGTGFAPIKAIAEHMFHERINLDEPGQGRRAWCCTGAPARGPAST